MVLTVTEFQNLVREHLTGLGEVEVKGEVSGFKISQNKFVYFYLKDSSAQIQCFLMSSELPFLLEDGFEIIVKGAPTVFQRRGELVFRVSEIEITGAGDLKKSFELLKLKLEKEGLFRVERKRQIPLYPKRIGLIASKDSAAIVDFYRGLKDRWGGVEIFFVNVVVQGKEAVSQIVRALDYFNKSSLSLDLVVIIRGGGSLEDLMPFNSEQMTRAIFALKYPVVVGVGHERDLTLAALAADIRASTPSKAAEIVFPNRNELARSLLTLENDLFDTFFSFLDEKWGLLEKSLFVFTNYFDRKKHQHLELISKLRHHLETFEHRIVLIKEELKKFRQFINQTEMRARLARNTFTGLHQLLNRLSPLETVKRGYAIITDRRGKVIADIDKAHLGQEIFIHLRSGYLEAKITKSIHSIRRLRKILERV